MAKLDEWIMQYIKHNDLVLRKIAEIKAEKNKVNVKYKDNSEAVYIVLPEIRDAEDILQNIDKSRKTYIVTLNKEGNLNVVVKNWNKLAEFSNLWLFFANPDSNSDKRWIVNPSIHNNITEKQSLVTGLKTMFDMVDKA